MLLLSHVVIGGLIGRRCRSRGWAAALGGISHGVSDSVPHASDSIGPVVQGLLGGSAMAALACRFGPWSPTLAGAFGGALPDGEVALAVVAGRHRRWPLVFPSHWQLTVDQPGHPYRFPMPTLPTAIEFPLALGGLCWLLVRGPTRSAEQAGGDPEGLATQ